MLECSRCHGRFNYEWSLSASWGPIRFGLDRSMFRCPICKELNSFDVANRGRDPALPTYNDMQVGVGGEIWGEFFGPFVGLLAVGILLLGASPYRLPGMVAILGGFVWLARFAYHLTRSLSAPARPQPVNLGYASRPRSAGAGVLLGLGIVLMLVGAGIGAMIYYSSCHPGANCGTGNPTVNLAIGITFLLVGLALVVGSALYRHRPGLSK